MIYVLMTVTCYMVMQMWETTSKYYPGAANICIIQQGSSILSIRVKLTASLFKGRDEWAK